MSIIIKAGINNIRVKRWIIKLILLVTIIYIKLVISSILPLKDKKEYSSELKSYSIYILEG